MCVTGASDLALNSATVEGGSFSRRCAPQIPKDLDATNGMQAAGGRSRSSRMVLAHPNANQHDNITMSPVYVNPAQGQRSELAGSRQELLSSHFGFAHPGSEDMELVDTATLETVGHVASVPAYEPRPTSLTDRPF